MDRWSKALDTLGRNAAQLRGEGWPVLYWDGGTLRGVDDTSGGGPSRRDELRPDPSQGVVDQLGSLLRRSA